MRLILAAVGRLKSGPEADLVEDYAGRIRAAGRPIGVSDFSIVEVEAPRGLDGAARQAKESALLLGAAADKARKIVLDERGRSLSSEEFARTLADWRDNGAGEIAFLIGGADGHDRTVRESADLLVSFGRATWPHMLVRAMLCEQVYRAMMILSGHPYHRA
ncbi:MAG: 23S rRNA (pseudouridine(1915)-N(3))-methyltransferase RlmH [Alphaproteobacteria bacterium]|nr:23S rRNA (pseudouridine(1915)-N(3))-methyltransferase RlmH [Alphaproteobacteria bacterium]